MAETEIKIPINTHKLDALKVALYRAGKDFDLEIENLFEQFYTANVPAQERAEAEKQIRTDAAAEKEQEDCFAAIRLVSGTETLCLTASGSNGLYLAASGCRDLLKDVEKYSLDTASRYFIDPNYIGENIFEVLTNAGKNPLLKTVMEFDFDQCTVSIKEHGKKAVCYMMEDLTKAYEKAESVPGISAEKREELLRKQLRGREIEVAEQEEPITLKL